MSSVVIAGDTSGSITLQAPAVAGATTLILPASAGTAGQVLTSAGAGATQTWTTPSASAMTLVGTYTPTSSATVDLAFTGGYTSYWVIAQNVRFSGTAYVLWTTDNFATTGSFQTTGFMGVIPSGGSAINSSLAGGNYFLGTNITTPGASNRINFNFIAQNVNSTTLYKGYNGNISGYIDFVGYSREFLGTICGYSYSTGGTAAINGIRFSSSSGASAAYSGTFKVYGIS